MIRLLLHPPGQPPMVVFGLDATSFLRLGRGQPIRVNLRDLDPDGPPTKLANIDIVIADVNTDDFRKFLERVEVT